MEAQRKILEGIKVVELANYVAAPIIGRICADMGAEVIKIEGRGGDAWRATSAGHTQTGFDENPLFDLFNVGKKSLSLNMKNEKGKEIFFQLLKGADILVTNTRNQSLVKLGIDYDSIKNRFPRLIFVTLTGYGYEGPDCNAPGFDNIAFWSRPGFSADMAIDSAGSYPVNSRYAMGDTIAGTTLFGAVMAALYQREKSGRGDFVTMSLYGAGIWNFGGSIVMAEKPYCHEFPEKRNFGIAMNLAYRCADGEWIRCTIFEYDRYAHKFYEALDVTEQMASLGVTSLPIMMEKAESIVPIYERVFATKPSSEWLKIFSDLDIVCGRLNHFGDVLEDQQAWANEYLQTYRCTNGAERILPTAPVRFGSQGALKVGKPVMFGENNQEVLAALGYSLEEIQKISDAGALG
ncbi:CaiB/BaiF CoA transferase family protein [Yanshouia hominis]|uniref:CoA transferase n=1 Tax=Yanshouia hominis TaxID=2763673 RepID=A0ABR7NGH1_9FIRM|nr:CoA transferase [Yanshouia hominis]MBC8574947.1 CoA transferase [Yanshouia hominis]